MEWKRFFSIKILAYLSFFSHEMGKILPGYTEGNPPYDNFITKFIY
jgi:hypothetical protein